MRRSADSPCSHRLPALAAALVALALTTPSTLRAQQPATRPDSARPAGAPAGQPVRKDGTGPGGAHAGHAGHGQSGGMHHGGAASGASHGASHGGMAQGAAGGAAGNATDHAMSGWKEMDAFHQHMMQAWHPAKQQHDVAPARTHAAPMADAAEAWARAAVPKACDTPATRDAVAAIARDARAFAQLVARPAVPDAEVRQALAALHERFEPVEHGCAPGGHGSH